MDWKKSVPIIVWPSQFLRRDTKIGPSLYTVVKMCPMDFFSMYAIKKLQNVRQVDVLERRTGWRSFIFVYVNKLSISL